MVHPLAAMASFGLLVLGCAFIAHMLRQSCGAILSALAGEQNGPLVRATLSTLPPVRIKCSTRSQSISPLLTMREAA